jgi:quinoprotein glucose dehydrogenase
MGPDGKLYFSIGDRGSNIEVARGRTVGNTDTGCVFRCDPDGSELEVFAYGLRNPQDLAFDEYGNLFTGDNNSDSGDQARWVYLVEGGDSGWRVGFQFMENPYSRGPFNAERLWYPPFPGQAANIVPPVANIATGPSGVAYFPGTGLPAAFNEHFFLVDFRGGAVNSGVHTFTLEPKGAGFELVHRDHFLWGILATDVKFGVDGGLYVSDWVEGWGLTGKGRIYRVHTPELDSDPLVLETKRLLAQDFEHQDTARLGEWLSHPDMRVRQEAQFALADAGEDGKKVLVATARRNSNRLARLHGIWGIGQIAARHHRLASESDPGLDPLVQLLADSDAEVRAQAAKVLGDCRYAPAYAGLISLTHDENPRARFFAALGLGKIGQRSAVPAVLALLKDNDDKDPYLRHAGVMALAWIGDMDAVLAAAQDASPAVRMGALLAMRRLQRPEIAMFLKDPAPALVLEAARAINDEPVNGAMPDLAALLEDPRLSRFLGGELLLSSSATNDLNSAQVERLGLEALLRRVLNANFHFGTTQSADALGAFAVRADAPVAMRVEAIDELGDWAHPSGRDRVLGLWRPVAGARQADTAAHALQAKAGDLLPTAPDEVRIALVRAITRLHMTDAGPQLQELVGNLGAPGRVRAEALNALAELSLPSLEQALDAARKDPSQELRTAATRLEGRIKSAKALPRLTAALESGTIPEQQAALTALGGLPGDSVDEVISDWLDRLRAGKVAKDLQLDVLDAAAHRSSPRIKRKLTRFESGRSGSDPLAAYQETLYGGDPAEGKKIFFDKPEAQCVRCHKIAGEGGEVGPDLTHIGSQKDRHYLLESIVLPNQQIAKGFESATVVLKNGDSFTGVVKNETPDELVLNSAETGLLPIRKSDIDSRRTSLSPMPDGLGLILTKHELRDLIAFLAEQK